MNDDEMIRQHIAKHGVTHCPLVAVAQTTATIPQATRDQMIGHEVSRPMTAQEITARKRTMRVEADPEKRAAMQRTLDQSKEARKKLMRAQRRTWKNREEADRPLPT